MEYEPSRDQVASANGIDKSDQCTMLRRTGGQLVLFRQWYLMARRLINRKNTKCIGNYCL